MVTVTDYLNTDDSSVDEYPKFPDKETLIVTESDIRAAIEDGRPTTFTADEQRLRYVVDVEVVDEICASDGCDKVPIFETTSGEEFCSPSCMERGASD